jgi:hypothetical protein
MAALPETAAAAAEDDGRFERLIREPETRPILQEQLVAEVKGIYAGLVMVESKCIEVDNALNLQKDTPPKLDNEQWQALIALHRTLLNEHQDFFLASQHSSASLVFQRLASKYSMSTRMWRHGIHSFLELLRHRLSASLEYMLTFVSLACSPRGLLWSEKYFPECWFLNDEIGDKEGCLEVASMTTDRHTRALCLAASLATTGTSDGETHLYMPPCIVQEQKSRSLSIATSWIFNSARLAVLLIAMIGRAESTM